jgi:hypothetical protein
MLACALVSAVLAGTPAPLEAQAPVLKKLLQFEHGWAAGKVVLVVGLTAEDPLALEAARQLTDAGLLVRVASASALTAAEDLIAVYATRSAPVDRVCAFARDQQVVCISWRPDDVEEGRASVAVGRGPNDKPEIVIHLASLKADGRMFNARVLRIARVIE